MRPCNTYHCRPREASTSQLDPESSASMLVLASQPSSDTPSPTTDFLTAICEGIRCTRNSHPINNFVSYNRLLLFNMLLSLPCRLRLFLKLSRKLFPI